MQVQMSVNKGLNMHLDVHVQRDTCKTLTNNTNCIDARNHLRAQSCTPTKHQHNDHAKLHDSYTFKKLRFTVIYLDSEVLMDALHHDHMLVGHHQAPARSCGHCLL